MTDQELLMKAATAVGLQGAIGWNPLENDGDALRLAVQLEFVIETTSYGPVVYSRDRRVLAAHPECTNAEALPAVRRQIVRAAALAG